MPTLNADVGCQSGGPTDSFMHVGWINDRGSRRACHAPGRLALLLGATLAMGCGGPSGLAPVHGTVSLNGKPLTEGFVVVTPAEGKTAMGTIQPDGAFVMGTNSSSDGVAIGTHPVTVLPPTATEGAPPSATTRMLPNRYSIAATSGVTVDVKPGEDNELVIELTAP